MNDGNLVIKTFDHFRDRGWMPGSSGALALMCSITDSSNKIYVTPDQADKRLTTNDLFILRSLYGKPDLQEPLNKIDEHMDLSKWAPAFLHVLEQYPQTRALAQVTTKWSVLAARMALDAWKKRSDNHPNVLRLSYWELLKDLGSDKELLIPIINLSDPDSMLTEIKSLLSSYPGTCAILVRDYGMVVWGNSFDQIERRVEVLEYVCEMQIYSYTLLSPPSYV
jgi:ribulose-5-phosphate 4-epimerase/fuculose-1-phosphate aldolase